MSASAVLAFVGAGPRTTSLLERLAANAAAEDRPASAGPVDIHVIDPFPPGSGRIWRRAQSTLLWMNSVARDVTMFTDDTVNCAGPTALGPSLSEWLLGDGRVVVARAGLSAEAARIGPDGFAPRYIQALYLEWTFRRAVESLPPDFHVHVHACRATRLDDEPSGRQRLSLADGGSLTADVVVLAEGYLACDPTPEEADLAQRARTAGLLYVPPDYTADLDFSMIDPGEDVIVRGFGLAFIDLMILVTEGRGGRFRETADGQLRYRASGREPVLHVGSRRGVPYHAKLGYGVPGRRPAVPRYLTPDAVEALAAASPTGLADFATGLWPLLVRDLYDAHYRRLFRMHADRTTIGWAEFEEHLRTADLASDQFAGFLEAAVPKPEDRFDLARIDRPMAGQRFADRAAMEQAVREYVAADLRRRADPNHSADAAVFDMLLGVYGVLAWAITAGYVGAADRIAAIEGRYHSLFSFLASGPPPRRLRELLALHEAGLARFAGPDLVVGLDGERFVGRSVAVPGEIRTRVLIDARLPSQDVREATDPLIRGLLAGGQLAVEDPLDADRRPIRGGQLLTDERCRTLRNDRTAHPRRFALGPAVSGSAGSDGFARPRFNAPGLRQNDAVARDILTLLHDAASHGAPRHHAETQDSEPDETQLRRVAAPSMGSTVRRREPPARGRRGTPATTAAPTI